MPLLGAIDPDGLARRLEALSPAAVRKEEEAIGSLLRHRAVVVRWAAAQALGRAGIGEEDLLERLGEEKNPLVLTEITESLAGSGDLRSLPKLREVAERHPSALVRSYAILAVADLLGRHAIPYLLERRGQERGRRMRATIDAALFAKGATEALPDLLASLRSRDPKIRSLVANLMAHDAPRKKRADLLAAFQKALAAETHTGVRGDLQRAIERLS